MTQQVDYAEAVEKAGGNAELAKELFSMLLQELPTLHERLQTAITQLDIQAAWDHAHKIYGATAYCGVPALRLAAREMETAVKSQLWEAIRERFTTLETAIQNIVSQGQSHLDASW